MADGGQPFRQAQRLSLNFGVRTDSLTGKYAAQIADSSLSERAREGAVLFQVAEAHLEDDEPIDALHAAEGALGIFREVGDLAGVADTLRLVTMAWHMQDRPDEAGRVAREELTSFRRAGDRRGEAAMLFSLAEADFREHGPLESLAPAEDARGLFHDLGDKKMEANVALVVSAMHLAARNAREAQAAAKDALAAFEELSDNGGRARALDRLAHALFVVERDDDGLEVLQDSLCILRDLGDDKGVAAATTARAETLLLQGKYRQAMLAAMDSLGISQRIGYTRGHAASLAVIVHAHLGSGEGKKAVRTAREGLERLREAPVRDRRAEVVALNTLIHALATASDLDTKLDVPKEALAAAEEALELCREIRDKKWTAGALQTIARFHVMADRYAEAKELLEDALEACLDSGDIWGQALVLYTLTDVRLHERGHEEALRSSREAASLFQQVGEKRGEAHVMMGIAAIHSAVGEVDEATVSLEEARALHVEMGDRRGEASALLNMAGVRLQGDEGDKEVALRCAEESWEILQESPDRRMQCDALQIIGNLHLMLGDLEQALEVAEMGRSLFQKLQDRTGKAHMARLAAQARFSIFVREEADLRSAFGDGAGADSLSGKDRVAEKRAEPLFAAALKAAREAVDLSRASGCVRGIAGSLHLLGLVLGASQAEAACREALQHVLEAARLSRECGESNIEAQALLAEADLRFHLGAQPALVGVATSLDRSAEAASRAAALFEALGDSAGVAAAKAALDRLAGETLPAPEPFDQPQPLPSEAAPEQSDSAPKTEAAPGPDAERLSAEIARVVAELARAATGLLDAVVQDSPLMESGMDSLTAVSFRNGLQQSLGVRLPSSLVFDYPTLNEVIACVQRLGIADV